ncbi:MarR family winged helix-turn-helix transcriptional regulator [Mycolicibacterium goodii]|uniref:MarR family winged helix-turn-helix transcriptional regulator n=1 Tax=Mycolicibacterium goodii TaxID=134601 RepID=A0ABS6HRW2_MYCGD|nr:MarR family winged helix-turn-helix transcriptional regulator [Mycolicibacterium goodii]OKH74098.1 MarR family transcriptional regulator [Mycobacterium sp. SWH-M5]MBU8809518.1 MarR family winged helix-turn-helix transcriptional regulator [Mycolicibacterium goodii]MBU8825437.1 MarR family winged helix-turn-helix transcriptional regulator [Mycolicibacterium goodii]MBU8830519.1 MarR family winged helix-turn-helix transcriptional regulator [Mycolicibacterium goodii]MBU8838583.1 MarR family wing
MPRYNELDELLVRVHTVRQRPGWRRRLIDDTGTVPSLSTLRVLRAVEQKEKTGQGASIGEVAEYMAVEHSTASRSVGNVVAAGLLTKTLSPDDQRRCVLVLTDTGRKALSEVTERRRQMVAETVAEWPAEDVDTLVDLLERLVTDFERGVCS